MLKERPYFAFGAALRLHGEDLDPDVITASVGLRPTHTHRMGEKRRAGARPYGESAWFYSAGLPEEAPLDEHLQALWADVAPAREFLLSVKKKHRVDVFCSYRSNVDHAGFEVAPQSLAMFVALDIPFAMSVIVVP